MAIKTAEDLEEQKEQNKIRAKKFNIFLSDNYSKIIVVIVVAILVFGYIFVLAPKYQQAVNFSQVLSQQNQSDLASKQRELSDIQTLLAAYDKIDKNYVDKINAIAPVIQNKEELFSEINYLISRNQLFLSSVTLSDVGGYQDNNLVPLGAGDSKLESNIRQAAINITITGTDYPGFKNLITTLEDNIRLMDIQSLSFSPENQSTTLTINTYYSIL